MVGYLPLLQQLVWPVFIAVVLFWQRGVLRQIGQSIADRIGRAESIEVGPGGVKLAGIQSLPRAGAQSDSRALDGLPHDLYMTHRAVRARGLDKNGLQYWVIEIWMDAETPELLRDVEKVVYHLHPTFTRPDREVLDPETQFLLRTAAYGEFNMTAEVSVRGRVAPLRIERYINFLPRTT